MSERVFTKELSKVIIQANGDVELPNRANNLDAVMLQRIDFNTRDMFGSFTAIIPHRIDVDLNAVLPKIREALGDPHWSPTRDLMTLSIQSSPDGTKLVVNDVELMIPFVKSYDISQGMAAPIAPHESEGGPPPNGDFENFVHMLRRDKPELLEALRAAQATVAKVDGCPDPELAKRISEALSPLYSEPLTMEIGQRMIAEFEKVVETYAKEGEPCTNAKSQSEISDPDPKRSST